MDAVIEFGPVFKGYATCRTTKGWYFYPEDQDWIAFHHNTEFSPVYDLLQECLAAVERWAAQEGENGENN